MKRLRPFAATVATMALALGCLSARIETRSHAQGDLGPVRSVHVLTPRIQTSGTVPSEVPPADALRKQATAVLASKGYRSTDPDTSDARLALTLSTDRVTRRTWSSDPDASALRNVAVDEAVVVASLFVDASTEAVWTGEARARLPDRGCCFQPTLEEIWLATLREAIEALPRIASKPADSRRAIGVDAQPSLPREALSPADL